MIEEIWKDILGYEGLYQVSSYGRVRSLDRYDRMNHFLKGRILKLYTRKGGYLFVQLHLNGKGKNYLVHRLVAIAFIPNPDNLPEVNHLDEDKTNNRVENLEFCDRKYNINFGTRKDKVRNTAIKNGYWLNLNDEERKIYHNEYQKKYYLSKKKDYMKKYYLEHKKKICEQKRNYYQENKEKICERHKENYRKKRLEKMTIQHNVTLTQ